MSKFKKMNHPNKIFPAQYKDKQFKYLKVHKMNSKRLLRGQLVERVDLKSCNFKFDSKKTVTLIALLKKIIFIFVNYNFIMYFKKIA